MVITENDLLNLSKDLLNYPYAQVCRHYVVANILSMMESKGWNCPTELAQAVVSSDDESALNQIKLYQDKHDDSNNQS